MRLKKNDDSTDNDTHVDAFAETDQKKMVIFFSSFSFKFDYRISFIKLSGSEVPKIL